MEVEVLVTGLIFFYRFVYLSLTVLWLHALKTKMFSNALKAMRVITDILKGVTVEI